MKSNMNPKHSAAKTKAIKDFSAHVSSGKASFFKKYGMDLVMAPLKDPTCGILTAPAQPLMMSAGN